jgi:hypothetical protein
MVLYHGRHALVDGVIPWETCLSRWCFAGPAGRAKCNRPHRPARVVRHGTHIRRTSPPRSPGRQTQRQRLLIYPRLLTAVCLSVCLSPQADINARGLVNETPLHLAVQYGQTEACELLLSQGSRLKDGLAAGSCRWLAVHLAANEDRPEVLFQLLLRPAEVDAEAGDGSTPLQAHTRRR